MTDATAAPFAMPANNPAPEAIIAERYRGLMIHIDQYDDAQEGRRRIENNSKLYYRLNRALEDLVFGLVQHDVETRVDDILEDLRLTIRSEAIRLVVESGSACWDDPEHARAFEEALAARDAAKVTVPA